MDLQDRALLLNPDDVAALLEGLELLHAQGCGGGRMDHCDLAVCRLADAVNVNDLDSEEREAAYKEGYRTAEEELRDRYDTGWDDGYAAGFEAGKRAAARA